MTENKERKRAKPRKKIDTFSVVRGSPKGLKEFALPYRMGGMNQHSMGGMNQYSGIQEGERFIVSPYSEFIPLSYLSTECERRTFTVGDPRGGVAGKKVIDRMYESLKKDNTFGVISRIKHLYLSNNITYANIFNRFSKGYENYYIHRDNGSSWIMCTPFGIYISRTEPGENWGERPLIPLIIPAVHKSNYIYQRMFILKYNGFIDTSKACIFVNKDLEDPAFTPSSMRREYINTFEKEFLKYQWNIWKVPASFIMDNCFLPMSIYPDNTSIFQMKEEKSRLLKEFYQELKKNNKAIVTGLVVTEDEEGDEPEGDSEDDIIIGEERQEEEEEELEERGMDEVYQGPLHTSL